MLAETLPFTYKEYRALPETGPHFQLVDGDLIMTPAPTTRHQRISRNLEFLLHEYAVNSGVGEVFDAPTDVVLSDTDVVQPDLFLVLSPNADRISEHAVVGAPDLVIEILSPASEALDRDYKRKLYARHGVIEYWIVDPVADVIEVWSLQANPDRPSADAAFSGDSVVASPLLPAFRLTPAEIFPRSQ